MHFYLFFLPWQKNIHKCARIIIFHCIIAGIHNSFSFAVVFLVWGPNVLFANASSHGPRQRRTVFTVTLRFVESSCKVLSAKGSWCSPFSTAWLVTWLMWPAWMYVKDNMPAWRVLCCLFFFSVAVYYKLRTCNQQPLSSPKHLRSKWTNERITKKCFN